VVSGLGHIQGWQAVSNTIAITIIDAPSPPPPNLLQIPLGINSPWQHNGPPKHGTVLEQCKPCKDSTNFVNGANSIQDGIGSSLNIK